LAILPHPEYINSVISIPESNFVALTLSRGMSTPSTSHQCPGFLSLPARNLAPDYSDSRLIHRQRLLQPDGPTLSIKNVPIERTSVNPYSY